MVRSFKFIIPLTDPPFWKKVHGLKNWSPPGIEPGSLAWNAIALPLGHGDLIKVLADPHSTTQWINFPTLLCVFHFWDREL